MKLKIPFSPPDMSEEEAKEVKEAILSGWITTGPRTKKLEAQIEEFINSGSSSKVQGSSPETCNMKPETQHTVVCLSLATAAMEMMLHLLDVQPIKNL